MRACAPLNIPLLGAKNWQLLRGLAQSLGQDEPQHGAALRVRLFDREDERQREQDRGMGW